MLEIVRRGDGAGFPADYVVARTRGRHAALIADWQDLIARGVPPGTSDERVWAAFLGELTWLHAQMNPAMRDTFAPLFGVFEIKTIVLCMRNRLLHRGSEVERLLERSLLAPRLFAILQRAMEPAPLVGALAAALAGDRPACAQLEAAYAQDGARGFEDTLMRLYLGDVASRPMAPAVARFFVQFIDLRNLMLLWKRRRWNLPGVPPLIEGGSRNAAQLEAEIARTAPPDVPSDASLETVLLRRLTASLERERRTADPDALVVAYIWRIYAQARNLAVLYHGRDLDARTLAREVIA